MRDAGVQAHNPLGAPQARLRRQRVAQLTEQIRAENAGGNASDIAHRIGYGILLLAALLIAIGTVTA
jgi:hypothetical protein